MVKVVPWIVRGFHVLHVLFIRVKCRLGEVVRGCKMARGRGLQGNHGGALKGSDGVKNIKQHFNIGTYLEGSIIQREV